MPFPIHHFKVGQFDCKVIADRANPRVAVKFWPSIPADEVLEAAKQGDYDPEALANSYNMLLIKTPEHLILVDTGVGEGKSDLLENLTQIGVEPESIDRVIITHGHGDHIFGIVHADGSLTFPNARYSMWKTEWEYWLEQDSARSILTQIKDYVDLIDHETEILPGICALAAPGHTVGHMALLLESRGEHLLHIVDAAHHPLQVEHTGWSPHFDKQPDIAATTRQQLFERAARENLLTLAYHFQFPGLGHVIEQDGKLQWHEISD